MQQIHVVGHVPLHFVLDLSKTYFIIGNKNQYLTFALISFKTV